VVKFAPKAHFFNYSNPMSANCRGIRKATRAKLVGLCHGVPDVMRSLAAFINAPIGQCDLTWAGINHLTWFIAFRVDGKDAWPLVSKRLEEMTRKGEATRGTFVWELYRLFGAFPAVGDRHTTEFFPQFFRTGEMGGKILGKDLFSFEATIRAGDEAFRRMEELAAGRGTIDPQAFQRSIGEHEQLIEIANALSRRAARRFSVNLPNEGQVGNLPKDAVIECPARVSNRGIAPIKLGEIPTGCRATVEKALLTVELAVEAALERNRRKFVQALIVDGAVKSTREAEQLADDLLLAQKEFLPGW